MPLVSSATASHRYRLNARRTGKGEEEGSPHYDGRRSHGLCGGVLDEGWNMVLCRKALGRMWQDNIAITHQLNAELSIRAAASKKAVSSIVYET